MARPTWEEYFMEITRLVAHRSTCLRRRVGAVLVKDKRILASGYNGAPSGLPHCLDVGCGNGRIAAYVASSTGASVDGLDFSERSIEFAQAIATPAPMIAIQGAVFFKQPGLSSRRYP